MLGVPIYLGVVEQAAVGGFPTVAAEGLIGHAMFGVLLGSVFAFAVDVTANPREDRFDE